MTEYETISYVNNEKRTLIKEASDLEVYKYAYKISLIIHHTTKKYPQEERFELASQIRRCSKSICANLTEGFAKQRFSGAEFKRFIVIAIGSAAEMQVWIQYSFDLGYITKPQADTWKKEYSSISRMLTKLHANI